jgi:hypothetical protein
MLGWAAAKIPRNCLAPRGIKELFSSSLLCSRSTSTSTSTYFTQQQHHGKTTRTHAFFSSAPLYQHVHNVRRNKTSHVSLYSPRSLHILHSFSFCIAVRRGRRDPTECLPPTPSPLLNVFGCYPAGTSSRCGA